MPPLARPNSLQRLFRGEAETSHAKPRVELLEIGALFFLHRDQIIALLLVVADKKISGDGLDVRQAER